MPQTIDTSFKIEADGFAFTECPRWHDGQFYFSDVQGNRVCRLSATGKVETLLELTDNPSGLGFLPDGDLLVVSVHDEKLLRVSKDGNVREHADLSGVVDYGINDMVVDATGRAYVGQFGYEHSEGRMPEASPLILVDAEGRVSVGPDALLVANGMVLTPGGRTLICAESAGGKLSAYDVGTDGALSNRRSFAELPPGHYPDGICLDAAGGVWIACVLGPGFVRVLEGGPSRMSCRCRRDASPMPACWVGRIERLSTCVRPSVTTPPISKAAEHRASNRFASILPVRDCPDVDGA
jgi:sugar lactone lactonase YvrE